MSAKTAKARKATSKKPAQSKGKSKKKDPLEGFVKFTILDFADIGEVHVVDAELRDVQRELKLPTASATLLAILQERRAGKEAARTLVERHALGTFIVVGRHTVDEADDRVALASRFTGPRRRVYKKLLEHLEQGEATAGVAVIDQSTVLALVEGDLEAAQEVAEACDAFATNLATRYEEGAVDDFHRTQVQALRALPSVG